jgi:hypothetical protein
VGPSGGGLRVEDGFLVTATGAERLDFASHLLSAQRPAHCRRLLRVVAWPGAENGGTEPDGPLASDVPGREAGTLPR